MAFSLHESKIVYPERFFKDPRVLPFNDVLSEKDKEERELLERLNQWRDSLRTGTNGERSVFVKAMIREWLFGKNGKPLLSGTDLQDSIALRLRDLNSKAHRMGADIFSKQSPDAWGHFGRIVISKTPRGWIAMEQDSKEACCKEAVIEAPDVTKLSLGDMSVKAWENSEGLLIERERGFPDTTIKVFDDLVEKVLG